MRSNTKLLSLSGLAAGIGILTGCGNSAKVEAKNAGVTTPEGSAVSVGVVKIGREALERTYTVSSELVPFQEIDVYAKESGFVKDLKVDYGDHVKEGQLMATLEIPELEMRLKQDDASIKIATDMITYAQRAVKRAQAQHKVFQLEYDRLAKVAKDQPGLVAQQEVDDSEGHALSSEAQVEEQQANLQSAEGKLADAQAKRDTDQALFDYSKITAPFPGVITQRYANLGTLIQSGMNNSTSVPPLVLVWKTINSAGDTRGGELRTLHSPGRFRQRSGSFAESDIPRQGCPDIGRCPGRYANHAGECLIQRRNPNADGIARVNVVSSSPPRLSPAGIYRLPTTAPEAARWLSCSCPTRSGCPGSPTAA